MTTHAKHATHFVTRMTTDPDPNEPTSVPTSVPTNVPTNKAPPERVTRTWRLVVAYHGTRFVGWQKQDDCRTVQDELERALAVLSGGEPVRTRAAGRTDAGVHARGQVVSTTLASRVPVQKMAIALCSQLPDDVSVLRAEVMPPEFDAKACSVGKRYVYRIHNASTRDPFAHYTSWHVREPLDLAAMQEAARVFVGEHDFDSFRSAHCDAAHARRYLWRASIDVDGHAGSGASGRNGLAFEVRGNAFCRHMVRCLAGTIVDVGRGRFSPADVVRILAARDRTKAGVTAPPEGLTLEEVYYPDTIARADVPPDAVFPGFPVTDEERAISTPY
jgi:tRNA pseudouridine38-40 synthase